VEIVDRLGGASRPPRHRIARSQGGSQETPVEEMKAEGKPEQGMLLVRGRLRQRGSR
jgi:hypothetical protein